MFVLDHGVNLASEQVNSGQEAHRTVALVFVLCLWRHTMNYIPFLTMSRGLTAATFCGKISGYAAYGPCRSRDIVFLGATSC
jgi:hypothetical protein